MSLVAKALVVKVLDTCLYHHCTVLEVLEVLWCLKLNFHIFITTFFFVLYRRCGDSALPSAQ